MRRILFVGAITCLSVLGIAQDLSKLTPEQLALYKKYTETGTAKTTGNVVPDTLGERKLNVYLQENPVNDSKDDYKQEIRKLSIFGANLFTTTGLTFDPKMNIPTPKNYILGTNDEIVVDISGHYDANYRLKVSPDGAIRIPTVGPVKVGGQSVEAATRSIRNAVEKVYPSVGTGSTSLNITLGNIRTIRVMVIGAATRPGTYTLPSLATVINALYVCGGPSVSGSMRDIIVVRGGKQVAKVDLYTFLQNGVLKDNIVLQDEDVVKIQPYQNRLKISGEVKIPAIFEARTNETLQDLLEVAGGFTEHANTDMLTVFRIHENKRKIINLYADQLSEFPVKAGDSIAVSAVYNEYRNRIRLRGPVFNPGFYALENTPSLRVLLEKADGLTPDAFSEFGFIFRKRDNDQPLIVGFNPGKVISGKDEDIQLQNEDIVEIQRLRNYTLERTVSIWGSVKNPGSFPFYEDMKVRDLIFKGQGFLENAQTDTLELVRLIRDPGVLKSSDLRTKIIKIPVKAGLNQPDFDGNIKLESGDQLFVRKIAQLENVKIVRIEGEVMSPGEYNLSSTKDRLSDVLNRAGGFTSDAYLKGAYLIRKEKQSEIDYKLNNLLTENTRNILSDKNSTELDVNKFSRVGLSSEKLNVDSLDKIFGDKVLMSEITSNEGLVGIHLENIMDNPKHSDNLQLEDGDLIYIPRVSQTVRVLGKVLFPTYLTYSKGISVNEYISNAGGFSENSDKDRIFVLYPNGTAKNTGKFLFFRRYPTVLPGSKIIVPQKPIQLKNSLSNGETVAVFTSVTSMLALLYSILR